MQGSSDRESRICSSAFTKTEWFLRLREHAASKECALVVREVLLLRPRLPSIKPNECLRSGQETWIRRLLRTKDGKIIAGREPNLKLENNEKRR